MRQSQRKQRDLRKTKLTLPRGQWPITCKFLEDKLLSAQLCERIASITGFMIQVRRRQKRVRSARREEEKSWWKEGKWKGVFPLSSFPSPLMLPLADLLSLIREVTNCKPSASSRYLVVHHPSPQPIWIRCRNNKKRVPFLSRGCKIFSTNPKMKPPTPYDSVKII